MAGRVTGAARSFRSKFNLTDVNVLRWFPGHMHKGLEQMQARLKDIDCVIEIHDARIPFSGRDTQFRSFIQLRSHILLLNKTDLVDRDKMTELKTVEKLTQQGVDSVFFTDLRQFEKSNLLRKKILPLVKDLTDSRPRYNREGLNEYSAMVIGVPNVGKSTFINAVRWANMKKKGKAVVVGDKAGVTRHVSNKIKVDSNPPVYIVDTPGILTPKIPDIENGMRLALCSCVPDHLVGEENVVDYLLYWLNKRGHFGYVDFFGLSEPEDNVMVFLTKVAHNQNKLFRVKDLATNQIVIKPDLHTAALSVLKAFRTGQLGHIMLDDDM
ncbi:mitochondrial GTPase 1-like [Babylonia areolata]|uniref:mitochondrial GTPase 1-like n=1 Tax=Babylonia areolata TaxID=304850 RepID=UPI003FD63ECD